jgi:hypothetical protein
MLQGASCLGMGFDEPEVLSISRVMVVKTPQPEARRSPLYGLEDGAGFGYVSVEIIDYFGELLFDYAAL